MQQIIEQLRKGPTLPVKDVAGVLGLSLSSGYDAVRRGDWPSLRFGKSIRVLTEPLCEQLLAQSRARPSETDKIAA